VGGGCDDSRATSSSPHGEAGRGARGTKTMVEEIFGPVLTIYVYDDDQFERR
jgi:1-pyrroline-5-carboxylate dehydrogenase